MNVGKKLVGIPSRQGGDACRTQSDKVLIVCDFDGTACSVDMGSKILDRFAGEGWRDIDRAYCANEIGSRLAYTNIAPLFRGSRSEMVEFVHANASLDPFFADFYLFCRTQGYDLKIASDGLDFYIETVLKKHGLADIEYYANAATFMGEGEGLSIGFPHLSDRCGRCGTCKSGIVKELRSRYDRIIYIGDSYSDVCASGVADLVFAKFILYEKCRENGTACVRYENFRDIMDYLKNIFPAVLPDGETRKRRQAPYLPDQPDQRVG